MPEENTNRATTGLVDAGDYIVLAWLTAAISIAALTFYYRHNAILLYGDAVAHINIARRVFDSRTPGLFQLGTVWLPLPHVLDIPFLVNDRLWQTGLGGSVPSMLAYVAGSLGIFRLVRGLASRPAAWTASLIYGLNPNLIYMQATAMTESLYLALFIWAIVYFADFVRHAEDDPQQAAAALKKCALLVSAAMLVRYDGWFLAAAIACAAGALLWRKPRSRRLLQSGLLKYIVVTGAAAALWLGYNYVEFGNPLDFATGPYSARAILEHSWTPTWTSYPGENSPRTATLYFLKVARISLAQGRSEYLLLCLAFISLLCVFFFARRFVPWVLLWAPVIFYPACVAWGSVPVYFPAWWPFTYYNVRYGLQMLPAIAVFTALLVDLTGALFPRRRLWVAAAVLLVTGWSYFAVWRATPITLREAEVNGAARMRFEHQLAKELEKLPAGATIMMDCSSHSGAVQVAGIPFRRVLRESNPPHWEIALSRPAESADYLVAIDHDAVAAAIENYPQHLKKVAVIGSPGTLQASIYRSLR
jgi:Dolichyl-phosphate-mannose-protein mannosyltransferase